MNLVDTNHQPVTAAPAQDRRCRLIRLKEVESLTGLKRSTIYALMREGGGMPKPVRLTTRAVAWREDAVLAWCASRTGV